MTARTTTKRGARLAHAAQLAAVLAVLGGCAHAAPRTGQGFAPGRAPAAARAAAPAAEEMSSARRVAEADRLRDSGELSRAAFEYFRAMRSAPQSAEPRERIAYLQLMKDPAVAEGIFASLIEADPKRVSAHTGRGMALLRRGDLPGARAALEHALELDPRATDARVALAVTCEASGDTACAEQNYARALELDPGNAEVHNNRGVAALQAGRYAEAAESFRRALHGRPGDPALYNNLGLALGRSGDIAGAFNAFRAAGSDASALNNLGYVHYLNGDPDRAIEQYERALAAHPADPLPILRNLRDAELRLEERKLGQP